MKSHIPVQIPVHIPTPPSSATTTATTKPFRRPSKINNRGDVVSRRAARMCRKIAREQKSYRRLHARLNRIVAAAIKIWCKRSQNAEPKIRGNESLFSQPCWVGEPRPDGYINIELTSLLPSTDEILKLQNWCDSVKTESANDPLKYLNACPPIRMSWERPPRRSRSRIVAKKAEDAEAKKLDYAFGAHGWDEATQNGVRMILSGAKPREAGDAVGKKAKYLSQCAGRLRATLGKLGGMSGMFNAV